MKKILSILYFAIFSSFLYAQIPLVIEGTNINNTFPGLWQGVNIPRDQPTALIYRNNSVTSINPSGYMLQAGDEDPAVTNNHLDGEVITGNKFVWNGTDMTSVTHGVFTGYNINAILKYNYLYRVPLGLLRKSNGMTNTTGGVAYNIVIDPMVGFAAKGMNNIKVYNNTFYSRRTSSETWRGLVDVYTNTDGGLNAPSQGIKVFNNIFYTKNQIYNIYIYEAACLTGFESDYNVFYCESGTPVFNYLGSRKTFAEWQALGYDAHSRVINPNFINTVDLVPAGRLDFGSDLGAEWQTGLSTTAAWVAGSAPSTADQNGTWQVGAHVYSTQSVNVTSITLTGAGGSSTITTDNGTLQLSAAVLPSDATNKTVTWSIINGTGQATINSTGLVTAFENGTVTARAIANDGSGVFGTLIITISNQAVSITSISVTGEGGSATITTTNGTLQLSAAILPANATNKSITWSINNGTGQATINSSGRVTAVANGTVTAIATANDGSGVSGSLVITITNQSIHVTGITVTGAGGATTISTDNGILQLTANVLPANATNKNVSWSLTNGTGQATINSSGLVSAVANGSVTAIATALDGSGISGSLVINITNQITLVTGITVTGTGGATTITTDNGTLQLIASVLPAYATNKSVTWSIVNGTGQATISSSGRVTAQSNGTVTAWATANDGSEIYGILVLTLSNQVVPVTGIIVTGAGGATIIAVNNGTLQLSAAVSPANASNKSVTWSLVNGSGQASISSSGVVTAISDGTVTARATADDGSGVYGTLVITIASQMVPVSSIAVTGAGGSSTISSDNGTLQLNAAVLPANATTKTVSWSVTSGTGEASINSSGLVTAIANGTVTARATANDGSGVSGSLVITLSNQIVPVSSISVRGTGGSSAIFEHNETLQLIATILPSNASEKNVTWSIENNTGEAAIDPYGLVSAISNGTVTAKASATDGSGIYGTLVITISGQFIPVTEINLEGEGGATTITADNNPLQVSAGVLPANATNKTVSWSVASVTGAASISADGLVTALENGTVTVQATANDGSGVYSTLDISVSINSQKPYSVIVRSDEIVIIFKEDFVSCFADFYNLQGNHIERKLIVSDTVSFNIAHIASGLYIIVLSRGELLAVEKVMIP